ARHAQPPSVFSRLRRRCRGYRGRGCSGDAVDVDVSVAGSDMRPPRTMRPPWYQLVLSVAGAFLGTVVPPLIGAGPIATLIGTILGTLLSTLFTVGGVPTRAKAITSLLLCLVAVTLTVFGFTVVDLIRGRSAFGDRQYTFPFPPNVLHSTKPSVQL